MAGSGTAGRRRLRVEVAGAVQGVGFRPFLYRTAAEAGLAGWIRNDPRGVTLEVEGPVVALERFLHVVRTAPPSRAVVREVREAWLADSGMDQLRIVPSEAGGERLAAVLPDLATCDACLDDIGAGATRATGADRRLGYPFTNCTDCGPRFSIIRALPYDRPHTTMAGFQLCPACRAEYQDPLDRRFHAQPTACPDCGPRLTLVETGHPPAGQAPGRSALDGVAPARAHGSDALAGAAAAIRAGRVVAVKGLGGFHLMVDAADDAAVRRLRERKRRPTRPLAVMAPGLDAARELCVVSQDAAALLAAPEAPIVLLPRRPGGIVAESVAPGNPYLGMMLPYTPLHHLLMAAVARPVVATSGNLSDESICIDNDEALHRLGDIADLFLLHDRPIERPVDDSVVQWLDGAPSLLRRARGYAPLPIRLDGDGPVEGAGASILAVGGQMKNAVALARGDDVFLSQHLGDLESDKSRDVFARVVADFLRLYETTPVATAHDLHPDYAATRWAVEWGPGDRIPVQHHHAHLAACLADAGEPGPALGVVWDGTGLGPDGTIWGGEFLLGDAAGYRRVAHLRPFRLPGGDAAVKEPRRVAMALLHAAAGAGASAGDGGGSAMDRLGRTPAGQAFDPGELRLLERVLDTGFQAPWTTSAGRLFDGVASLMGLRQRVGHEGEAAMALEYAVGDAASGAVAAGETGYLLPLVGGGASASSSSDGDDGGAPWVVDWAPALAELLADVEAGVPREVVAARFHAGLIGAMMAVAERVGCERVALSGGCFQNRVLTDGAAAALRRGGFRPLLHRRVPPNDGGLALGQVAVAAAALRGRGR
jgi:hydrogenase maturation protein HypF